jgi:hypothetical protein
MKLAICTPSPNRVGVQHKYTFSDLILLCAERDVSVIPMDDTTPGNLPQSRNLLMYRVSEELDEEDWALWIDGDISFDGRLAIDLLHRDEDVIVRGYPRKPGKYGDPPLWSVDLHRRGISLVWNEERNMLRVLSAGFGWVLMRARVAKLLAEKIGVRGIGGRGNKTIPAFDHVLDETGTECGEDISCWRQMNEIGVVGWCTPTGLVHNGELSGIYLHALQQAGSI